MPSKHSTTFKTLGSIPTCTHPHQASCQKAQGTAPGLAAQEGARPPVHNIATGPVVCPAVHQLRTRKAAMQRVQAHLQRLEGVERWLVVKGEFPDVVQVPSRVLAPAGHTRRPVLRGCRAIN